MKKNIELGLEISDKIIAEVIPNFKVEGDLHQMKLQLHPIISNALYNHSKEIIEAERFRTLINLSREFNDEEMQKVIKSLGYKLTIM